MNRIFNAIGMAALAVTVVSADADDGHIGPVTDIAVGGEKIFSCSQAGIFEGIGEIQSLDHRPDFRVVALDTFEIEGSSRPGLLIAGGEPGVSGVVSWRHYGTDRSDTIADDMIYSIAVSVDARHAAAACADGRIFVCTLATADWKFRHRHTAAARAVTFSPDGKWIASAGLDGAVIVSPVAGDSDRQALHLDGHTAGVDCLTFSPDSSLIASGSRDSKVRVHQVAGKLLRTYKELGMADEPIASRVPARILSIAWGKNVLLAGTSKGTLHSLSLDDDRSSEMEHRGAKPITALAIDLENQRLLVADRNIATLPLPTTK